MESLSNPKKSHRKYHTSDHTHTIVSLQEFYTDLLTPEYVNDRKKEIRKEKGRGHAGATVFYQYNIMIW